MIDINWKTAFPARLQKRMDELGLNGKSLAKRCGLSNGSLISQYLHGGRQPTLQRLEMLEKALDLPSGWFQFPEKILNYSKSTEKNKKYTRVASLPILRNYEAYNWIKYGKLPDICDYKQAIMDSDLSARSFILEIEGDSMTSERAPHISLSAGDMALVNPDLSPEIGNLVVIKTKDGDVKVREYQKDGKQIIFKSLDMRYPLLMFDEHIEILGVLVQRITGLLHPLSMRRNDSHAHP